ncbi:MAG TPA: PAS domain S-box protein [Candidatus Omnitrophota bacterium]|nr:PAS domain S-box protein [Candidatus Omnitrophota bacterium]
MKIRKQLILLVSFLALAFLSVFLGINHHEKTAVQSLFRQTAVTKKAHFNKFLNLKGKSLEALVLDYTYWDELVDFIKTRDVKWAKLNMNAVVLSTYNVDALWVYNLDLSLVHAVTGPVTKSFNEIPIPEEILPKLFQKVGIRHFFVNTSQGLMEIRAATIHPGYDTERKTPPKGYFFAGRLWSKSYLDELSEFSESRIQILPVALDADQKDHFDVRTGSISFTKKLNDWDEKPAMMFRIETISDRVKDFNSLSRKYLVFFLIFATAILGIFTVFIIMALVDPLWQISRALATESSQPLVKLRHSKSEFGEMADLIDKFFNQKKALTTEIEEHKKDEELIRQSEERFRSIFESTAAAIMLVDKEERLASWNKFTEELFGMGHDDLHLKLLSSFYPPEEWQKIRALNIREKGSVSHFETQMYRKDGGLIDVAVSISFIKDQEGKIVSSIGIIRDITERKKAEEAIRESEERFRSIFESTAAAIMLVDKEERLVSWNKFTEELFGMGHEDLHLKSVRSFYPPEEWQKIRAFNIRAKGSDSHFEIKMYKKDQSLLDVAISISFIKDQEGKIVSSIGIIRDITERKKAEEAIRESEERFQQIADSAGDWIWEIDRDGKYTYSSPSVEDVLGYKPEEVRGRYFHEFFWSDEQDQLKVSLWEAFGRKEEFKNFLNANKHKNGHKVMLETTALPHVDKDGQLLGYRGVARDITTRQKAENELRETMAMKAEFISIVSHELRTPLTPIKEGASLILEGVAGEINEKQRHLLTIVKISADRLHRLIDDVLDFQKLESNKMPFFIQKNDLSEVIHEVYMTMVLMTQQKGLDFVPEIEPDLPKINFDRDKIAQVLTNLINNAIKFTEQGRIRVKAKYEDNMAHVTVEDTGPGIRHEDISKLFRSFQQLETAREKKIGGTGLGLAICKDIIQRHNGKIWVESEFGKGSAFHFVLPV